MSDEDITVKKRKHEKIAKEFRYSVPLEKEFEHFIKIKNYVYSDRYFKNNQSLNGVIKNLTDFNQIENNIILCNQNYLNPSLLTEPHLGIFEVRKSVEYRAVLKDLYIQFDFDLSVPAFRGKCFEKYEKNMSSFKNYIPIIQIENDVYEQYFYEKTYEEMSSRVSFQTSVLKRIFSVEDLDKISPVKQKYSPVPTSERDILRLSSLSVHELEDILLKRKSVDRPRVKIRSLDDVRFARTYPMLEPLILKDESYDSEKIRMRIAEHKKIVRITIAYTLAFFILVIITFFIIYYA